LEKAEQRNEKLESELAEAKQTILQLAEANSHLKQENADLKQANLKQNDLKRDDLKQSQPKQLDLNPGNLRQGSLNSIAPAKPIQSPVPVPTPNAQPAVAALSQQEILRRRQQASLAHPVFPVGNAPGQFSDQDIGWFD
jgi:chromosome segregation ATPase